MTDPVLARVAAIKTMPAPALKTMWRDLHGTEAPPYNRRFLESRLAYRIQELAYGGRPGRPAGMLVFDVELLRFQKKPAPPAVPTDVAAPPADAEVTKSGLASKVLAAGNGTEHPKRSSEVTVHYSGWTTDGQMFDSSVMRGQPATFPLNRVIAGWTEGLQLMVVGEKRRFWIPEKLAYQGQQGAPQGMLVFDVELLSFK